MVVCSRVNTLLLVTEMIFFYNAQHTTIAHPIALKLHSCFCIFTLKIAAEIQENSSPQQYCTTSSPLLVNLNFSCYTGLKEWYFFSPFYFFFFRGWVFFFFHGTLPPQRPHRERPFQNSSPFTSTCCLWFCPLMRCVCSPSKCGVHIMNQKPHAIMWGVSTNIHAVNKRVAGNAAVNSSRVIIRWFYSLRSKAANSKAISNLKGKSHLLKKKKKEKKGSQRSFLRIVSGIW